MMQTYKVKMTKYAQKDSKFYALVNIGKCVLN